MFDNINYLSDGNDRQKRLFNQLVELEIMLHLAKYDPLLIGTIPIGIDIESSDVDIVICSDNFDNLATVLSELYGTMELFELYRRDNGSLVCRFVFMDFAYEIFASSVPSRESNGWRHMIIENQILRSRDQEFRDKIISLKRQGIKTEPAFAMLLGLDGDPYDAILLLSTLPPNRDTVFLSEIYRHVSI